MKAKVIISLGMVVGLAVCSVVAYASTTEVSTKMEPSKEELHEKNLKFPFKHGSQYFYMEQRTEYE